MPSLGDSALIFFLALLLFGPKKLPELARQLGKLMGEFRRASNEFRMQMEEELRVSEQDERQKKIAALEAASPLSATSIVASGTGTVGDAAVRETTPLADPLDLHPHMIASNAPPTPAPTPIAISGDLNLMPPSTGLPIARGSSSADLTTVLETAPHEDEGPELPARHTGSPGMPEAQLHG